MSRCGVLAAIVWVIGLVTAVPLATYHLLFRAPREQYAWLILFIIGWPFLYWPTVGPILLLLKLRRVYRGLQQIHSADDLRRKLAEGETEDVIIAYIAHEHRIPKFLARRVYRYLLRRLAAADEPQKCKQLQLNSGWQRQAEFSEFADGVPSAAEEPPAH